MFRGNKERVYFSGGRQEKKTNGNVKNGDIRNIVGGGVEGDAAEYLQSVKNMLLISVIANIANRHRQYGALYLH